MSSQEPTAHYVDSEDSDQTVGAISVAKEKMLLHVDSED